MRPDVPLSLLVKTLLLVVEFLAVWSSASAMDCKPFPSLMRPGKLQSENFVAANPKILQYAEKYRAEIALDLFDWRMPKWSSPCEITVRRSRGPGGVTSFDLENGQAFSWQMVVTGSNEQDVLLGALPHEVAHTVIHSAIRQRIPRWIDEGIACLYEQGRYGMRFQYNPEQADALPTRHMDTMEYPFGDGEKLYVFYSGSNSLVEYLDQRYGRKPLRSLLLKLRYPSKVKLSAAIQEQYGLNADELSLAWLRAITGKKPLFLHAPPWCQKCPEFKAVLFANENLYPRHFIFMVPDGSSLLDEHDIKVAPTLTDPETGAVIANQWDGAASLVEALNEWRRPQPLPAKPSVPVAPQSSPAPVVATPLPAHVPEEPAPVSVDVSPEAEEWSIGGFLWKAAGVVTGKVAMQEAVPAALKLVGISSPMAAMGAIAAYRLYRWRKNMKGGDPQSARFPELLDREATEAKQLLQLGKLERRDPVQDAVRGMFVDDELQDIVESPEASEAEKSWARSLGEKLARRWNIVAPAAQTKPYSNIR